LTLASCLLVAGIFRPVLACCDKLLDFARFAAQLRTASSHSASFLNSRRWLSVLWNLLYEQPSVFRAALCWVRFHNRIPRCGTLIEIGYVMIRGRAKAMRVPYAFLQSVRKSDEDND
jgi:hypothetical protein